MSEEFKRPAILDEMDTEFNTAPIEQSGSIMEGILNEQHGSPETSEVEPKETPEKKELPSDYLPLNSSIQELSKLVTDKFSNYDKRFNEFSNNYQPQQAPAQAPVQTPNYNYDPEAPVTMQHFSQFVQAYTALNQSTQDSLRNSVRTRAQVEFMRYKQENPSFDMDPNDIDRTIDQAFKTGQGAMVQNANWRGHFDQLHRPMLDRQLKADSQTIEELRKEIETLKKRPTPTATTPVSPALGRVTSRPSAIDSPLNQTNDDITKLKSFNQKGGFKRFGNDLKKINRIAK